MGRRTAADVWLGNLVHRDCGLDANIYPPLFQRVRQRQGIDGRRQHAHMVGAGAFHFAAAVLDAAPEIAAAYHKPDLAADIYTALDDIAYRADDIKIQPEVPLTRERFAADLNQYPFILPLHFCLPSCSVPQFPAGYSSYILPYPRADCKGFSAFFVNTP